MVIRAPKGRQPYSGTAVPVDRSKEQISKLLREYGAEGISWSENFQSGELQLRFVVSRGEGSPPTMYRITPAAFKEKHSTYDPVKGRHVTVEAPNWPRAMRLLHAWLKTKLESIAYGLTEVEEEFLAQRVIRDSAGNEATVGELVLPAIEEGGGRLSLEAPKRRDGAIDASFRGPA